MSDYIELKPTFCGLDGVVVNEGDEVLVRGIGDRMLGIGTFAGSLVVAEADGDKIDHPVIEIQGRLVGGGKLDLWTIDRDLIESHRLDTVYPISLYLAEIATADAKIVAAFDGAFTEELGIRLD